MKKNGINGNRIMCNTRIIMRVGPEARPMAQPEQQGIGSVEVAAPTYPA